MSELIQLPAYSDDELAKLSLLELIDLMVRDEDRVPRNVIDECARRGDTMVEYLSSQVTYEGDWWREPPGEWWLKLHTAMILGLIPSEAAGLALVKFMRNMSHEEDFDLQDWLISDWPALFQNKPASVLPELLNLCEDRTMDWYIRAGAIDAYMATAQRQGSDALAQALEWLAEIVADEDEDWDLRLSCGNTLLNFPRIQYRPLLEATAASQSGWGVMHFSGEEVQKAYAAMQDKADWERFSEPWKFYSPDQITARQQRWEKEDAGFDSAEWDEDDDDDEEWGEDYDDETYFSEPYVRIEPKIGRNDPCPCGSGKKYKKCCLNGDEAGDIPF